MMKGVSETLAGRVAVINLLGFSERERFGQRWNVEPFLPDTALLARRGTLPAKGEKALYAEIWTGGFPALVILETHVVAEVLKSWWHRARNPPNYFYRDRDGREIDLLFDVDGKLWPVEIKHGATVRREWAAPFAALERLKKPVGAGAVVCLTPEEFPVTREITALPIGAL